MAIADASAKRPVELVAVWLFPGVEALSMAVPDFFVVASAVGKQERNGQSWHMLDSPDYGRGYGTYSVKRCHVAVVGGTASHSFQRNSPFQKDQK